MSRIKALTVRNIKEILRDKTSLIFCLILPVAMFALMYALFGNIGEGGAVMFEINNFTPGIASFGFSFIMLYISLTISGDNGNAFTYRIYASPTKSVEYLLSFIFSSMPLMLAQLLVFYLVAIICGITLSLNLVVAILLLLVSGVFYSACGVLFGVIAGTEKQAGPLCSIVITGSGLLGGVWMPLELIGGGFLTVCKCLPFYNVIEVGKLIACGDYLGGLVSLAITLGYAIVIFAISLIIFNKKRKG